MQLLLCYDIACQYFRNFQARKLKWWSHFALSKLLNIVVAIGKMHEPGHKQVQHQQYSLNLVPGAGFLDGETLERIWGNHNSLSNATKSMGPGARQDRMEGQLAFWNFEKYKGMGEWSMCPLRMYF